MKIKRIVSVAAAALTAASLMTVSASTASADEGYHAYIGIQTQNFSFRNAWNDTTYGKDVAGDDGTVYFDQITGWDGADAVNKGGVFTDAEITGDGTYSVKVTDFDFGSDEYLNLLFVSTDIPLDSGASISDVKVIMDGQTKYTFDEGFLSPDETSYLQPMAINIWNSDLGGQDGLFGYVMPEDSVEIQFTVSGLSAAAPAAEEEAPAETEAPAADDSTTSASTGNTSVGAIAAVMAVAAGAAFAAKKRN